MIFRMRHPATALALLLAGTSLSATLPELSAASLQSLTSQQAARVALATAYLNGQTASLGLGSGVTFALRHALTNTQGECVARFDQVQQGSRVEDASVVVKVEPDGTCRLGASSLAAGIALPSGAPALTGSAAIALLTAKLSPTAGYTRPPVAELVVFPASQMGELILARNAATGKLGLDPLRSSEDFVAPAAYMLAYRITAELRPTGNQPNAQLTAFVDAESGAILSRSVAGMGVTNPFHYATGYPSRSSSQATALAVKAAATANLARGARAADTATATLTYGHPTTVLTPATGFGNTLYAGTVSLPTSFDPVLNGFGLLDTTRGGAVDYFTQLEMGTYDAYQNWVPNTLRPAGNMVVTTAGMNAFIPYTMDGLTGSMYPVTTQYDATGNTQPVSATLVPGLPYSATAIANGNIWGDGTDFVPTTVDTMADGVFTPTGQSSAADAMNTMTCAYDFLKYEFNRLGPDGTDAAMTADVNNESYTGGYGWQTLATVGTDPVTGKAINVPFQLMRFGTGVPAAGMTNLAEPTIIGTAIGHMLWEDLLGYPSTSSIDDYKNVTQAFAQLMSMGIYSLGALHGTMRTALIAPWIYGGVYANGGYTTSMFHPSLDGVSPDYSYDGSYLIGNPSSLYGAGPFNRAFFFMAEGASAKPTSNSYSTFMPGGMPGIGLEKTCKIAYKAVSENLASHNANGPIMRAAMIQAASDLYGPGSPEVIATTNAWAAVNVGGSYGNADPIRVWFDMQNFPADSDLGIKGPFEPNPRAVRYPYAPAGEPTQMKANISGTTNTGLTWTVNPAPYSSSGYYDLSTTADGNITASGLYQGPLRQDTGSINVTSIQATSTADPNQFAQGMVFNITFDWDGDGNNDALDLGYLALAYSLDFSVLPSINDRIWFGFPSVGEGEVQMSMAAFKSAFWN